VLILLIIIGYYKFIESKFATNKAEILLRDLVKNHEELFDANYYLGLLLAEKKLQ
jgi:hypothetical protein